MIAKKLIYLLASLAALVLLIPAHTHALVAEGYAAPIPLSDVYITALQVHDSLDYVELYNGETTAVDMRGWTIRYGSDLTNNFCEAAIDHVLLAKDYGLLADPTAVTSSGASVLPLTCLWSGSLATIGLFDATSTLQQEIVVDPADQGAWVRLSLGSTYSSKELNKTFRMWGTGSASSYHADAQVWTGGWYTPPANLPEIRIVEILPRPRGCSPTETSLRCADYVKLRVGAGVVEQDLAVFALRTSSGGLSRTSSNGADLANFPVVDPGYMTVPIALSNDGGYAWLDDIFGAQTYGVSVVMYPSAEATAHEGAAWALDPVDGTWKWTSSPQPDAPNYFPPPEPASTKIAPSSTLALCREGQERNPATNRCRSIVDAIAQLVPCREGQERNPDTNRCRSVLAASNQLVPCAAGQERNPETNRCRKIVLTGDDIPLVTDVPSESRASRTGWIVAGVAVVGAGAYALYEWRDVLRRRFSLRRK